ncbi:MAG: hypothetical protein CMJ94_05675 [Planctomycetes bacterium]|nr:hypothetical protein [Planctomycetota bacterium]
MPRPSQRRIVGRFASPAAAYWSVIQTWESAQLCEHCSPTELRRSSQPILTIELIREADPAC